MKWFNRIKKFSVYSVGQAVNLISPLLITPHIIDITGESGLGKVGICLSICFILMGILDYSSYLQGTKLIAVHRDNINFLTRLLSSIYSYKLLLLIILLIPAIVVPVVFFPEYKWVFLLSLTMLIGHLLNPNWILYGLERYDYTAVYNIISKAIFVSSVFIFVQEPRDYIWVNFFNGISTVFVYAYAFFILNKEFNIKFSRTSFVRGIQILKSDYRLSISEFCLSIYQYIPIIIIGAFAGAYNAGVYRVLEQIFGVLRTFIFMFFNFSYPAVCAEFQSNFRKGLKTWRQFHFINLILIGLASVVIIIFGKDILMFFNVNEEDLSSVLSLLYIAMIIPLLIVVSQAFRQLLLGLDLMKWYSNVVYIYTFSSIILLLILIPIFDLRGAFFTMICCELLAILIYAFYVKSYLKKSI